MTQVQPDALEAFKAQFNHARRFHHFNNAGQAPLAKVAAESLNYWNQKQAEEGAHCYPALAMATTEARKEVSRFLGCHEGELAFCQCTSAAVSQVALGLKLNPGDEVVVWDQEYPSNFYPWITAAKRCGAKIVVASSENDLSVPLSNIEKVVTAKTRVIATSWVQYRTGAIVDLKSLSAFARPRGIFTSVDIIQGAGYLPFNFKELMIDAASGGSHKWMAASHGAGYLCLRGEHLEKIEPLMVGAMTYGGPDAKVDFDAKPVPSAQRFESGSKAMATIIALGASAKMIGQTGIDRIAQEVEWLARKLAHGLRELGYIVHSPHGIHHRGSIVNFSPGPDSPIKSIAAIEAKLLGSIVSYARRPPGIRLSPHAFNSSDEIELLLRLLNS